MNREEYMKRLTYRLRKLPREDYDKAVSYFTEYFEDAGAENEVQAIEDLGEPEMAAAQIVREMAVENAKVPIKDMKRGLSAIWIGILAVFAVPIGVPLALGAGAVVLAAGLVIMLFVFSVIVLAFSITVSSVPCIVISIWLLFTSFADGVATFGLGLISLGAGILLIIGSIALGKWMLNAVTRMFGKLAGRRIRYER